MKFNIYKWHRTISLIIAIPVVLWAASGFMHPIMTTIRPRIATQFLMPVSVDSSKIKLSLQTALIKNDISQFHNFRLVHIDTNWFYQVQPSVNAIPLYFSTKNGRKLKNGDEIYARYLAKQFLEGQKVYQSNDQNRLVENSQPQNVVIPHDCCDAATNCVMNDSSGSKVVGLKRILNYNDEYKFINRLLPVYCVNFDRADGIRIYVETVSDRFGFAVDNKRAAFDTIFSLFHTWSWMDGLGNFKYIVMIVLLLMAIATTAMGIYIFFKTKTKNPKGNTILASRRNHRWTSIVVSLFTLMFAMSGIFHAIDKFKKDTRQEYFNNQMVISEKANLDYARLQKLVQNPIENISMVQMGEDLYWQVTTKAVKTFERGKVVKPRKDLMKDKEVSPPNSMYFDASNYILLSDGEKIYAKFLAKQFSKNPISEVQSIVAVTKFDGEYGFVNKRLPVWKVGYLSHSNERYYVETSSGLLSVRVDDGDLVEGYSFSFLHKHHFMDFAGKEARDFSTMIWAMGQIMMVIIGLILWRKTIKKRR